MGKRNRTVSNTCYNYTLPRYETLRRYQENKRQVNP
nr:MAG TPA: hypothetical protein [Caudoviricetes sp.]